MTISIMQPTYLPWIGYFKLINDSNKFVFLDNVKFEEQSWQRRNKLIINNGKEKYYSIPYIGSRNSIINKIIVNDKIDWRLKHRDQYLDTYKNHKYCNLVINEIFPIILDKKIKFLSELNIKLISKICKLLEINTQFYKSSDLNCKGTKSDRLLNIINHFNETIYLSTIGSKDYIEKENKFKNSDLKIIYQNFKPKPYSQENLKIFIPYLSIIDLISNYGLNNSKNYLNENS